MPCRCRIKDARRNKNLRNSIRSQLAEMLNWDVFFIQFINRDLKDIKIINKCWKIVPGHAEEWRLRYFSRWLYSQNFSSCHLLKIKGKQKKRLNYHWKPSLCILRVLIDEKCGSTRGQEFLYMLQLSIKAGANRKQSYIMSSIESNKKGTQKGSSQDVSSI